MSRAKRKPGGQGKNDPKTRAKGPVCNYCYKRVYLTRAYAKQAARIIYPGEQLRPYKCPKAPSYVDTDKLWHLGHLHETVREGQVGRDERYGTGSKTTARETRYSIPQAMVDIMERSRPERGKDEGEGMATVGELARVSPTGFDKKNSQYKDVNLHSPGSDKVALVYTALRAYAVAHGFEEGDYERRKGFVGRVSLRALIGELFGVSQEDDKLKQIVSQISDHGRRQKAFICLDNPGRFSDVLPIWWISTDFKVPTLSKTAKEPEKTTVKSSSKTPPVPKAPPAPVQEAPSTSKKASAISRKAPSKRLKAPPMRVIDRAFAIKSILDVVAAKYDTALTRFEINDELKARGLEELSRGEFEAAVGYLEEEKAAVTRKMSDRDVDAIKKAGGIAPAGRRPMLVMLRKHAAVGGTIPPLLGSLEQLRAAEPEVEPAEPAALDAKPIKSEPGPAAETKTEEEPEVAVEEEKEEVSSAVVAEDDQPRLTPDLDRLVKEPSVFDEGESRAMPSFDTFRELTDRINELETENQKLRAARDGLLAVIETLK